MLKIGIPAQDLPEGKFGTNTNYLNFISNFGEPILILPCKAETFNELYKIDALLLPGGQDINPDRYHKVMYGVGVSNPFLEHFDVKILPNLIGKMPIFGICRGLQTLNVHFGGTLQNLYGHPYSISDREEVHKLHEPNIKKGGYKMSVNSFHHQAIAKLADNFKVELVSEPYPYHPEAISDFDKNIFAVQWHPERLDDDYSKEMFDKILKGVIK